MAVTKPINCPPFLTQPYIDRLIGAVDMHSVDMASLSTSVLDTPPEPFSHVRFSVCWRALNGLPQNLQPFVVCVAASGGGTDPNGDCVALLQQHMTG